MPFLSKVPSASASLRLCVSVLFLLLISFFAVHARLITPDPTLLLRDRHGAFLAEIGYGKDSEAGYWQVDALPQRVVAATLVTEDRRFWEHPGVDVFAAARAARQNLGDARRTSGASTIAMQVARMEYPGPRTYARKALEAVTACLLTVRYGREAVLAHYLRIVPYSNRIHGIAYAARRYLDKPVEDLSWAETAFLAAIPQAPSRMNPFTARGRQGAVERGRRILVALRAQGVLSEAECDLAMVQIATLQVPRLPRRSLNAVHAVLRFQKLFRDPATRRALPSATIVETAIDLDIQDTVAVLTAQAVRDLESRGVGNAGVMVLDRQTNEVRAAVGSAGYFDTQHAGAYDYTRVPRSPGSTLKPFLYGLALERGRITPATILDDIQRTPGDITNADEAFLGPLLPRVALANSRNVPAANLLALVGVEQGYAFLRDLGLHRGDDAAQRYGLGLSIGALPVTLEHLVHAFTMLAREGVLTDVVWYRGQPVGFPRRLLSEETARQVTLFLADPMARLPTFPRMGASEYPFPVAVKTGTSSRYRDALTVAYSTRYVVGVWIGRPDYRPMSRMSAFSSAASLAHDILTALQPDERGGLNDLQFPAPRGFRSERVCALTGKRATPACGQVFLEWFRTGQEPAQDCDAHVQVAVDRRDGLLASSFTPSRFVDVRTFTTLGPRFAAWADAVGLSRPPTEVSPLDTPRATSARAESHVERRVVGDRVPKMSIVAPEPGMRLVRDPDNPPARTTLALRVVVDPPAQQVVWYVDNVSFQVVDYPYTARWALKPGAHTFQVRLPFINAASAAVRVRVQ
jgi:penicillin-binding protein 1C